MTSRCVALVFALGSATLACTGTDEREPEVPTDVEYCAEVVDWDAEWSDFEREVLERVNLYREAGATCGTTAFEPAPALVMNESLRCAARAHALDMATRDYVMHTSPEGTGFADRAEDAEYDAGPLAEALAAGLLTPEEVVVAWMGREAECTYVMHPDANEFGIAYLETDEATFGTYWVAVFGQRM
ncbi:CAP domain-containing protein [Nannocystaceae bacterium ST9]